MRLIPDGEDLLEEISRMATHSSILSWKIPWTEEPGGLQSTGLQSDPTEATEHAGTTQKEPIGGSAWLDLGLWVQNPGSFPSPWTGQTLSPSTLILF